MKYYKVKLETSYDGFESIEVCVTQTDGDIKKVAQDIADGEWDDDDHEVIVMGTKEITKEQFDTFVTIHSDW